MSKERKSSSKEQSKVSHASYGWDDILKWEREAKRKEEKSQIENVAAKDLRKALNEQKVLSEIEIKEEAIYDPNKYQQLDSNQSEFYEYDRSEKKFRSKKSVKYHFAQKNHECEDCGKKHISERLLKMHKITHKKFQCDICIKVFSTRQRFEQHKIVHSGIKKFKCDKCEKRYYRRNGLHAHYREVHNSKKYECEFCEKVFRTRKRGQEHQLIHDGIKNFECKKCNRKFHKHVNCDEWKFKCKVCKKEFKKNSDLIFHLVIHT